MEGQVRGTAATRGWRRRRDRLRRPSNACLSCPQFRDFSVDRRRPVGKRRGMIENLHGVSTGAQLKAAGIGRRALASRIARGEAERVHPNLFRTTLSQGDERQLAAIGLLAIKKRGMVTGAAGVRLSGNTCRYRKNVVDISVPYGIAVPEIAGVCYRRSSHLGGTRPMESHSLPVAPLWWAMGDLAYDVVDKPLAEVIAAAIGSHKLDLRTLEYGLGERRRFPGRARLRDVMAALGSDLPFSKTERLCAAALRRAGIAVTLQHPICDPSGRQIALADLAEVSLRLNLEIDGPHHWLPDQAERDRKRDRSVRPHDWQVDRFAVYEIDRDMEGFIREALQIIERRRAELLGREA